MASEDTNFAYVMRGKNRRDTVLILSNASQPLVSSEIQKVTKMYKSHTSRALKELQKRRIIKCINPRVRTYRLYTLTEAGALVAQRIKQLRE